MIVITSISDARKLGVSIGSIINEKQALPHMAERQRKFRGPISPGMAERIEKRVLCDIELAKAMRGADYDISVIKVWEEISWDW